jgi:hypothetical protein
MNIKLYTTKSDSKQLKKVLSNSKDATCLLKDSTDILNPVLTINSNIITDITKYNFLYIPKFNRYYFINNISTGLGGNYILNCSVDVLHSYYNEIRSLTCYILRQEKFYSPYIIDEQIPTRVKRYREKKNIGTVGNSTNFYLTVSNGGDGN